MTTLGSQFGDVAVIVAAGGAGVRLGPGAPKALRWLAGEPLLRHAVRGVTAAGCVGCVVVAAPPGEEATVEDLLAPLAPAQSSHQGWDVIVVSGGAQRQESVAAALAALPPGFEIVLVHDAARALVPPALVEDVAAEVRAGHPAVIPVLPVADTIVEVDPAGDVVGQPDRASLRAVQTPQGFQRAVLAAAHEAATSVTATDDSGLVAEFGVAARTIPGSAYAMKITTRYDLVIAEALLADAPTAGP